MSPPKSAEPVFPRILVLRDVQVMLDSDLALLYGVTTKRLNEQVRRNLGRFPEDFRFQLTTAESEALRSQFATSSSHGGRRYQPWVFTEHGAIMAATILNSEQAVAMSVYIVRAFVKMRQELLTSATLEARLQTIEKTLLSHDSALRDVIRKLRPLLLPPPDPPKPRIGFHRERGR
jgi:ORF6N domain